MVTVVEESCRGPSQEPSLESTVVASCASSEGSSFQEHLGIAVVAVVVVAVAEDRRGVVDLELGERICHCRRAFVLWF